MSWGITSLLTKVTRPPTATVISPGDTPVVVTVTVPVAAGAAGDGAGAGDGEGADGDEYPDPHAALQITPATNAESRFRMR